MNELSISASVHCDASTAVTGHLDNQPGSAIYKYVTIQNKGGYYSQASIFLTAATACSLHSELERLYPELATAADSTPDEVLVRYADEHAGDTGAADFTPFDESDAANPPFTKEEVAVIVEELENDHAHEIDNAEHASPLPSEPILVIASCNGACKYVYGTPKCEQRHNDYLCTLPVNHAGPHIACGGDDAHNLHVWPQASTDDSRDPMLDELRASPNARKFGAE